eukprot:4202756-Amphidinium_carterae.1
MPRTRGNNKRSKKGGKEQPTSAAEQPKSPSPEPGWSVVPTPPPDDEEMTEPAPMPESKKPRAGFMTTNGATASTMAPMTSIANTGAVTPNDEEKGMP